MAFEGVMRHDVLQTLPRPIQGDMISVHVGEEMRDATGQTTGLRRDALTNEDNIISPGVAIHERSVFSLFLLAYHGARVF